MRYLRSFVPDESEEIESLIAESEEISKLKLLIRELKSDRLELKNEIEDFLGMHENEALKDMNASHSEKRDLEEMQDDIDFLSGENKEL